MATVPVIQRLQTGNESRESTSSLSSRLMTAAISTQRLRRLSDCAEYTLTQASISTVSSDMRRSTSCRSYTCSPAFTRRPVERRGEGKIFPCPTALGGRHRSKILTKVFQMAFFWPQICIKSIFGRSYGSRWGSLRRSPDTHVEWPGEHLSPYI